MFKTIKIRYIRELLKISAFIYISLLTYNSYASVCFLPTGNCDGTNETLNTTGGWEVWPGFCPDDYPLADCPEGNECEESETTAGCYKKKYCASGWSSSKPDSGNYIESNGCYQSAPETCEDKGLLAECPEGNICEESDGCYSKKGCDEDNGWSSSKPESGNYTESNGCYKSEEGSTCSDDIDDECLCEDTCENYVNSSSAYDYCVQNTDNLHCWNKKTMDTIYPYMSVAYDGLTVETNLNPQLGIDLGIATSDGASPKIEIKEYTGANVTVKGNFCDSNGTCGTYSDFTLTGYVNASSEVLSSDAFCNHISYTTLGTDDQLYRKYCSHMTLTSADTTFPKGMSSISFLTGTQFTLSDTIKITVPYNEDTGTYWNCSGDVCTNPDDGKKYKLVNIEIYEQDTSDDSECPEDKICFKINYTCNGGECTEFTDVQILNTNYSIHKLSYLEWEGTIDDYSNLGSSQSSEVLEQTSTTSLDTKIFSYDKQLLDNFNTIRFKIKATLYDSTNYSTNYKISYPDGEKNINYKLNYLFVLSDNDEDIKVYNGTNTSAPQVGKISDTDNIIDININIYTNDVYCEMQEETPIDVEVVCNHISKMDCEKVNISGYPQIYETCQKLKEQGCVTFSIGDTAVIPTAIAQNEDTYTYTLPYKYCRDKSTIINLSPADIGDNNFFQDFEFVYNQNASSYKEIDKVIVNIERENLKTSTKIFIDDEWKDSETISVHPIFSYKQLLDDSNFSIKDSFDVTLGVCLNDPFDIVTYKWLPEKPIVTYKMTCNCGTNESSGMSWTRKEFYEDYQETDSYVFGISEECPLTAKTYSANDTLVFQSCVSSCTTQYESDASIQFPSMNISYIYADDYSDDYSDDYLRKLE